MGIGNPKYEDRYDGTWASVFIALEVVVLFMFISPNLGLDCQDNNEYYLEYKDAHQHIVH